MKNKIITMKKYFILPLLVVVLFSCNSKIKQENKSMQEGIKVTTISVKKESNVSDLQYSGTIEAWQTIPLSFRTAGTVQNVMVNVGDNVTKGKLLATVDASDANNMYQMSLSKYKQAKDAYDRLKTVYDKGSLPEIKWIEMESNLSQAKSSLDLAKNNLDKCNLFSPVNGVVGSRNTEPGMSSLPIGKAPIEIVDISRVNVKISVPENELNLIQIGKPSYFKVSALNDKSFQGKITNISPIADAISRTYEAKILVNNSSRELKPGMVCDVSIGQTAPSEMILIPYQCVTNDENKKPFVFVVDTENKKVKKQYITTKQYQGDNIQVISGLSEGQVIVLEGKEKLSDDTLIAL